MSSDSSPLILAIETATRAGSVSLVCGQEIISSIAGDANSSHSSDLIQNIEAVLEAAGRELTDVAVFAAAHGPGSFTGLRIGLATIKALAVSTGRKCVGVSTLAAIARAAGDSRRTVSLLPAGRGELFGQMFAVSAGAIEALDAPAHLGVDALLKRYGHFESLWWAGDGARAQLEVLSNAATVRKLPFISNGHETIGWTIAPEANLLAEVVGLLAFDAHRSGHTIDAADLRATYVRLSDAEINHGDGSCK